MRVPASLGAVPLLAGCAAGIVLADEGAPSLALCAAAAAALSLIAAIGFFADGFTPGVAAALASGFALSGVSLGATAADEAYHPDLLNWFDARGPRSRDGPVILGGVLREDAAVSAFGVSLLLDVRGVSDPGGRSFRSTVGGVRLSVSGSSAPSLAEAWRAGRTIRITALLRKPTSFGDPGVPDEVRGLARHGVILLGSVKSASLIDGLEHGNWIAEAAGSARSWTRRQLGTYVGRWDPSSAAVATAVLIGDRSGLSEDDERRLQEAGTYHVIAISGGNIAILAALLLALLRLCAAPRGVAPAITIAVLLFYGQIASGGASVSRAVIAACVFLGARILDHRGPPLNALAVAAAIGLATSPLGAFDGGFVLSFGATAGILAGVPLLTAETAQPTIARGRRSKLSRFRRAAHSLLGSLRGLLAATLCAEVALAPVSALLFSRITVAGLALNFVAIPLMTLVQVASMATLALSPVAERAAAASGYLVHVGVVGLLGSARLVDFAPWTSRSVVPPAWWLVATYYATSVAVLLWPRGRRFAVVGLTAAAASMMANVTSSASGALPSQTPGRLRVVFLDVGQGDATLVRTPSGRVLLVDAGGLPGTAFDIGERIVGPALRALGVRSVDTLVLTHGDPDHIGGAPAILRRFGVHDVWEGVPVPPHPGLRDLLTSASAGGVVWRTLQSGDRELAGGTVIRVLHPPPPDWERQRVRNEDSIVLEVRFGDVSIVLPGDIGVEGERRLTPLLATAPITILKAPHHGSATSSSEPFIAAAHPAAVIFSAGRGNRFGHPAPVVVSRYRAANSLIFRTDEDGAIVLDTDGHRVWLTTWSGRRVGLPD